MGRNEYWTILQLISQLIHFKFCRFMYRVISKITWGDMIFDNITVDKSVNIFQVLSVYVQGN